MPEVEIWKVFASLGVPGVALGVLYLLFKRFHWEFPKVPRHYVGPIILLFMVLVAGVVFFALSLWAPTKKITPTTNISQETVSGKNYVFIGKANSIIPLDESSIIPLDESIVFRKIVNHKHCYSVLIPDSWIKTDLESDNGCKYLDSQDNQVEISIYTEVLSENGSFGELGRWHLFGNRAGHMPQFKRASLESTVIGPVQKRSSERFFSEEDREDFARLVDVGIMLEYKEEIRKFYKTRGEFILSEMPYAIQTTRNGRKDDKSNSTASGWSYLVLREDEERPFEKFQVRHVFAVYNNRAFNIICKAPLVSFRTYESIFKHVVSHFVILDCNSKRQ